MAQGKWDLQSVAAALRACYPDKLPAGSSKGFRFFRDERTTTLPGQWSDTPVAYKKLAEHPSVPLSPASAGTGGAAGDGVETFLLAQQVAAAPSLP